MNAGGGPDGKGAGRAAGRSSAVPKFYEKSHRERLEVLRDFAGLDEGEVDVLARSSGGIGFPQADRMVENAVGTLSLPVGIATNFRVNGADYMVPMAIEEPSVVAAASLGAKTARILGGFEAEAGGSYVTGQIQVLGAAPGSAAEVAGHEREILDAANAQSATLSRLGRGAKSVSCRDMRAGPERMLIVELLVDAGDAMGANVTNSMCEAVAPLVEGVTGGTALLRILSNYSTRRMAKAKATFERDAVGGDGAVGGIISAYRFARHDVYRAVTHNKGIMNGVAAVAAATGQDCRAIEAAAHAYAARDGTYRSLTEWRRDADGNLVGELEMPLAVGIVGGVTAVHPVARVCTRILGVRSAAELARVAVSAGLAQNYSAMRALATEGIQKGHMKLHARNLAAAAGAAPEEIDGIAAAMVREGNISLDRARGLAAGLRPPA